MHTVTVSIAYAPASIANECSLCHARPQPLPQPGCSLLVSNTGCSLFRLRVAACFAYGLQAWRIGTDQALQARIAESHSLQAQVATARDGMRAAERELARRAQAEALRDEEVR